MAGSNEVNACTRGFLRRVHKPRHRRRLAGVGPRRVHERAGPITQSMSVCSTGTAAPNAAPPASMASAIRFPVRYVSAPAVTPMIRAAIRMRTARWLRSGPGRVELEPGFGPEKVFPSGCLPRTVMDGCFSRPRAARLGNGLLVATGGRCHLFGNSRRPCPQLLGSGPPGDIVPPWCGFALPPLLVSWNILRNGIYSGLSL